MNPGWPSVAMRFLFAAAAIAIMAPSDTTARPSNTNRRIVVVGEVQGAANTVSAFLEHLDLIDPEGRWSGGETTLIQTGDLIDDGEHVRAALDLFMRLQDEAGAAGGRVIVLMGNHEAMNILGELRDVNYLAYAGFADADSERRQRAAWQEWAAWRERRAEAVGTRFVPDDEAEAEWLAVHPPGWIEYVESMRPEGIYGAWLRSLPVAVEIDGMLFIHAGVSPAMEGMDVISINRRATEEIETFDRHRATMVAADLCLPTASAREMVEVISEEAAHLNGLEASARTTSNPRVATLLEVQELGQWGSWSLVAENGPLWFRGPARWPDNLAPKMMAILNALGVKRMVTGQSDGNERLVRTRFDNRVLLTSVGLSDDPYARGGQPAALEIVDKDYFVVTLEGRELLIDGS